MLTAASANLFNEHRISIAVIVLLLFLD